MNTGNTPRFVKLAKEIMPDPQKMASGTEEKALEYIEVEKQKELAISRKARNWEKGRKRDWQRSKKAVLKSRTPVKHDLALETIQDIRKGGKFDTFIYPCPGYIVVKVDEQKETTENGIILPGGDKNTPNTGVIIAIGTELKINHQRTIEPPAKKGDKILFRKFAGMEVNLKGEDYLFLSFGDVIGTMEDTV